ncbi:DUF3307 domain-containing protein [Lederbergia lenta]|uniref:Protein of uncharacterized function (DUF3307) n=1 Tax=Lederbergia lenta TaxID=1467 RepID=A0A2X4WLS3_LEDLE|nr:DUF3307 domain-containing protein [Lederbergia lenta]MEC2324699.1 DUF3307 domain-containing protein [Lederbergia lenta]SQI58520.1 Protein of uncharacterised function (DUF3307) [Lederbergia lenta]
MLLLLLIIAHLIADFWLQTDEMVKNKLKRIKRHLLHHFFTTALVLTIFWGYYYQFSNMVGYFILPLCFIIVTHFIIDVTKIKLLDTIKVTNEDNLRKLGFFLLDQVLHIIMLIITGMTFFHLKASTLQKWLLQLLGENDAIRLNTINALLFILIIYILATSVSGHIIKLILGSLPSQLANFEGQFSLKNKLTEVENGKTRVKHDFSGEYHYITYANPLLSRGKLIGYIERLLVILLTTVGAYPAIAFIVTAKSIARFKQLDDRNWAEYFLLGTLSSMFLGTLLGFLLKLMIIG